MSASGTHIVDGSSLLAAPSELDLFSVPLTQVAVQSSHWAVVRPKNVVDDSGPWLFELQTGPHYCLPRRNYLAMRLRLVRTDTAADLVHAEDIIAPVNRLGSSLIKTLKVYLGSRLIEESGDLYAHRAMLETELNYGKEAKTAGHLQASLYYPNAPPDEWDTTNNSSVDNRRVLGGRGDLELLCPLTCNLFNTQKALPSHCNLRIEIFRNSDDFLIRNFNLAAAGWSHLPCESA